MKHLLQIAILSLLVTSCSVARFQPVQRDSLIVRYIDSLRIKDSVVMVSIPVEASSQVAFASDTSHLETSVAESDAWIDESGRIHHILKNKSTQKLPTIVPVFYRARVLDEKQSIIITETVEVEKELTWWQRFRLRAFWYLLGVIALFVIWKIARLRLHL